MRPAVGLFAFVHKEIDLKKMFIRIFSRDEKKQDDMRHELQAKHPENAKKVKFYIGDVRNIITASKAYQNRVKATLTYL